MKVLYEHGMSGWPIVRITGSKRSVLSYLREYSPDTSDKDLIDLYFLPMYKTL